MKKKPNYDLIVAASAVVISLCALVVSLYEAQLMRKHEKANLWPYLHLDIAYSNDGFRLELQNRGTGPAKIKGAVFLHNGKVFKNWDELINQLMPTGHKITYSIYKVNSFSYQVLPAGEQIILFKVPWNEETRAFVKKVGEIEYELCYCSFYEDCWTLYSKDKKTQKEGDCSIPEEDLFDY
ncbi:MAG: hypothetical protein AAFU64_04915 [Bacteroidota bacterium]